jgi:hypothetical protein
VLYGNRRGAEARRTAAEERRRNQMDKTSISILTRGYFRFAFLCVPPCLCGCWKLYVLEAL